MHFATFAALFVHFSPFLSSATSSPSPSPLLLSSLLPLLLLSSLLLSSCFFFVGCFTSLGFDSWLFQVFLDGTALQVSLLWVFNALEHVLVGIVVDQQWISGGSVGNGGGGRDGLIKNGMTW